MQDERARERKTVLVVSRVAHSPACSCGSRVTFQGVLG